jgi:hypothetical protein
MLLQSARDLKLQVAFEVFAPLVNDLLAHAQKPSLENFKLALPPPRLGIGIGIGRRPEDFSLAIRLQDRLPLLDALVRRITALANNEVDVVFVGAVRSFTDPQDPQTLRAICRPLTIGCSVAHVTSTAGTLGLIARHNKTNRPVLVSNSHVFAHGGQAAVGDGITQPGRLDGGMTSPHVAALLDFVALKTSGSNQVDAAIAVPDSTVEFAPNIVAGIGAFTLFGADILRPSLKVIKLGRTSGFTRGTITATEIDHIVMDSEVGNVTFDDQIEITGIDRAFSQPGDSGSLVLTERNEAVGLVFCGNEFANNGLGVTYANRLAKVMDVLNLSPL